MIKRSFEDKNTIYICLFGKRYIFNFGKYIGWCRWWDLNPHDVPISRF